jgi:colanic acid biosynthesis glycosyl transferase WcaI
MNILILTQYHHPEPVPKTHELATSLAARGHNVQVITGFPNYPSGRRYPGYPLRPWRRERIDGVEITRLAMYSNHSSRALLRILNILSFTLAATLFAPFLARRVDVIYVFHPPPTLGIPAVLLARLRRVRILYALHDLWPETVQASGMLKNSVLVSVLRRLELWVYSQVDMLGVITEGFRRHLVAKGVEPQRIVLLPHWADERIFRPVSADPSLRAELGGGAAFLVVFAGNIGKVQALDTVIDAARLLRNERDIAFTFIGDGVERERLQDRIRAEALNNVQFFGARSVHEMASVSAVADAMLVTLAEGESLRLTIPSKLFSALACGRPIIASADGDTADLVNRLGVGVAAAAADASALAASVLELRNRSAEELEAVGRRARAAFEREFSMSLLVGRHEEVLLRLAGHESPAEASAEAEGGA